MKTPICLSCLEHCQIRVESGEFDADGQTGTIKGNLGDHEVSDCCSEPVEEVDSELWEYWLEIKKLAKEMKAEYFIRDCDHESCVQAFENGVSAEEFINTRLPF